MECGYRVNMINILTFIQYKVLYLGNLYVALFFRSPENLEVHNSYVS